MTNSRLVNTAEYVKLAEVCYTDFSSINLTDPEQVKSKMMYKTSDDASKHKVTGLPQSFAEQFVKDWSIQAQWTDREEETSFSATLFQKNDANGKVNDKGEYVLAFKGTVEGTDLANADIGDIVMDGFALKQSIDLINFRQQLLGSKGDSYQVLTLQQDEICKLHQELSSTRPQTIEEVATANAMAEKLKQALDSGQYILDNTGAGAVLYKMQWIDSTEIFHDERATGLGLSWDKISITGHSLAMK